MPSISAQKLYPRSILRQALLAAGQFSHISEAGFDLWLDAVYNPKHRNLLLSENEDVLDADKISWDDIRGEKLPASCIHEHFVQAFHSGLLDEQIYSAAETIDLIGKKCGHLCSLCHSICYPGYYRGPQSMKLSPYGIVSEYICPSYLKVVGGSARYYTDKIYRDGGCLCYACRDAIYRYFRNSNMNVQDRYYAIVSEDYDFSLSEKTQADIVLALTSLITNQPFRKRLRENRSISERLRFDPTKVPKSDIKRFDPPIFKSIPMKQIKLRPIWDRPIEKAYDH